MCERQPCIAESLFQGRGVRVQGCEEGGEGPPAPFWVAGPLSVGCESAISMGAPIAEALALVLTNLCLLICDRRVEEVAHRSTETGGTSAGAENGGAAELGPSQAPGVANSGAKASGGQEVVGFLCSARGVWRPELDLWTCGPPSAPSVVRWKCK